jgi:Domain of unknown function (DUF5658)
VGLLAQYSYLQILDLLTTMAFLSAGVQEGNPIVNFALNTAGTLQALLLIKGVAIAIGIYCWRTNRHVLLYRANWWFAMLVAWNLLAVVIASRQIS